MSVSGCSVAGGERKSRFTTANAENTSSHAHFKKFTRELRFKCFDIRAPVDSVSAVMRSEGFYRLIAVVFLAVVIAAPGVRAQETIRHVKLTEGVVYGFGSAGPVALLEKVTFEHGIVVFTNGVFRVKEGRERKLEEGQILDKKGMLKRPNGSLSPVFDHITYRGGNVIELRDGTEQALEKPVTLANGTVVYPDATMRLAGRGKTRMIEGEIITIDGGRLPTSDTITLWKGQVKVQKNGAQIDVRPRGSIVMEDGTRVYGDGRVVHPNGDTSRLREGQIIEVPGVGRRLPE